MENNQPLVSVIMNCYNSDKYLREAIDSVLGQTYTNWEIIFWDNQSTDKSAKIVKSYDDARIKYFYAPTHTTLGEGRNKALEKVSGEFISFLDCDDIYSPKKIEKTLEVFEDKSIGFVYTNGRRIDEYGNRKSKFYKKNMPSGFIYKYILGNYNIYIPSVMFRKKIIILHRIVFDSCYDLIEEFDFFLQILKKTNAYYINFELSYWRVHSQSNTWNKYNFFSKERRLFLLKMNWNDNERKIYANEIQNIEYLNIFQDSIYQWRQNNKIEARKLIFPILFKKVKYFIVFFMMFFQYKHLKNIVSFFKKIE